MPAQRDTASSTDSLGVGKLALWFQHGIAPIVAADAPDGLVLDTTGADHLHGGELPMPKDMIHPMEAAGFRAKAVVADPWGAAHAIARYGRAPIAVVPLGGTVSALADLPLEALRLPGTIIDGLATLGVSRIWPLRVLTKHYGIRPKTVAKWNGRPDTSDRRTGPKVASSTILSIKEEAIIVAFRPHTLLPLDDCLYALQATIQHRTRSSLHRCLQRHGIMPPSRHRR